MSAFLRVLGRTACVLLLVGAVAGGLYHLFGAGAPPEPPERGWPPDNAHESDGTDAAYDGGHFGRGRGRGWEGGPPAHDRRRGREAASVGRGIAGMLGTAIQIGVIGAAVVGVERFSKRRRRPVRP